jgi:hypothetical protein
LEKVLRQVLCVACLLGVFLVSGTGYAAGADAQCVSTWRSVGKLWDQYGEQIKTIIAKLAAGEDGDSEKMLADWEKAEEDILKNKGKVDKYLGDSPHQTGPRPLSAKKRDAVTTHQRTWISELNTRDSVTVRLDGKGGKAAYAKIAVCTVDEKGVFTLVKTRTVIKGDFSKVIEIAVPNVFGKMVSVLVSKQGGIGFNAYRYQISLGKQASKQATVAALRRKSKAGGKMKGQGKIKGDFSYGDQFKGKIKGKSPSAKVKKGTKGKKSKGKCACVKTWKSCIRKARKAHRPGKKPGKAARTMAKRMAAFNVCDKTFTRCSKKCKAKGECVSECRAKKKLAVKDCRDDFKDSLCPVKGKDHRECKKEAKKARDACTKEAKSDNCRKQCK